MCTTRRGDNQKNKDPPTMSPTGGRVLLLTPVDYLRGPDKHMEIKEM